MYTDSIQARREIARNFTELNYRINPLHWQTLCMGVNRDLGQKTASERPCSFAA